MMNESAFKEVQKIGEMDSLYHAGKIFDRDFESFEELIDFGTELDTIEKVMREIKNSSRVLFDADFTAPLEEQIQSALLGEFGPTIDTKNPGILVATNGLGRMGVSNEMLIKASRLGGVPLIDSPTSWEYFKWKLEYDTERMYETKNIDDMHIVKGLNGLNKTSLSWIGKIPPTGLIELRSSGAINEIREILSLGIAELTEADELAFQATSHKVFNNLNFAFNQHQKNIRELINKKWKVGGRDFGSWLVVGTAEVTAACLGTPIWGLTTVALNQLTNAPKLKDLPKSFDKLKDLDKEKEMLKKSPLGLMFSYKK